MKLFNPIQSQKASGTFGGLIIYNYNDLSVARNWGKPSGVKTERQLMVESNMTILSRVWSTDLNEGQRIAWNNFAKNFVWKDLWGRDFTLKGMTLFTKFNFQLIDSLKTLQLTPPPAVNPSEISFLQIQNDSGEVLITLDTITEGEISSQSPFIDIWVAGDFVLHSQSSGATDTEIVFRGLGMPQGVNPVKSDYRHRVYQDSLPYDVPPGVKSIGILFQTPEGGEFTTPQRIAMKIKRYNKYGRYSNVQSLSFVSSIAE